MTQPNSLTKPDQAAEARKLDGKPKSSLQLLQNQRENKIGKWKLAGLFDYKKAIIL